MKTSEYGLQFISGWEGLRNHLYDDGGTGRGNCTIGVGHLVHYDPCDGRADEQPFINGITDQQAYDLLAQDVQNAESSVSKTITIALNQNQFDALVDFTFNCGAGSLAAIATVINTGGDVCAAIAPYNKGTGSSGKLEVLDALVRRRAAECELYKKEEEGLTQAQYDELKEALGNAFKFLKDQQAALKDQQVAANKELVIQQWLMVNGRTDELKQRLQYEAAAAGITLP